jgi:hypothetical protein
MLDPQNDYERTRYNTFSWFSNFCYSRKVSLANSRYSIQRMVHAHFTLLTSYKCRYDIIAQLCHAKRLAERLLPAARMVDLHGAHLVSHERPDEVKCGLW